MFKTFFFLVETNLVLSILFNGAPMFCRPWEWDNLPFLKRTEDGRAAAAAARSEEAPASY
jgi:hypothetical protein